MNISTTRRALVKAAPLAALTAAVPAVAIAPVADRRAWEAALAQYVAADKAANAFDAEWCRVCDAWEPGKPSMDSIHWREFPFPDRDNIARTIDLDKRWSQFLDGEGKWWWSPNPETRKAEYSAALDSVQAYRDAVERHNRDSGMDAADEKSEALSDALVAALDSLMETPAPDLAALRWKLDYLTQEARKPNGSLASYSHDFVVQTLADIARLLPEAK